MANVIRQDVIEVSVNAKADALTKLNSGMEKLKSAAAGAAGGGIDKLTSGFDKMKQSAGKSGDSIDELKDSIGGVGKESGLDDAANDADGLKDSLDDVKTSMNGTEKSAKKSHTSLKAFAKVSLSGLARGLTTVGSKLTQIAAKASGAALRGLKKIASVSFKTLIAGLAGAGAAVYKFANLASDLEETKNKVDVAFGSGLGDFDGAAADVMKWSKTSTTSMGLAQQTALDTAALFGDMGTSMGLTKDKAAEMSMALTQQAADLASFKNMGIDEVTTALNGVFTGETESLNFEDGSKVIYCKNNFVNASKSGVVMQVA